MEELPKQRLLKTSNKQCGKVALPQVLIPQACKRQNITIKLLSTTDFKQPKLSMREDLLHNLSGRAVGNPKASGLNPVR